MSSRTLKLEPAIAFNGLDVLVARDEGLFELEGLNVEFVAYPQQATGSQDGTLENPVTNQGSLQNRGEAHMFQG
jgi:hypothetical protein